MIDIAQEMRVLKIYFILHIFTHTYMQFHEKTLTKLE